MSVRLFVTDVLGGGGRDRAVKQRATCQQRETVFIFQSTAAFLSGHNLFTCPERERDAQDLSHRGLHSSRLQRSKRW